MKLNEFETKLATVSDAKLQQMLASSRANDPEVAVKLILSECKRRGMDGLDPDVPAAGPRREPRESPAPGSGALAHPQEHTGYAGSDAPDPQAAGDLADAPATAPKWLNEETKAGMPLIVKALLLAGLGAVLALAWKFTH